MTMAEKAPAQNLHESILIPDTVAPYQYVGVFRAKGHLTPEEKLMFAVLNDAIGCLEKYHGSKRRGARALYREARNWILITGEDAIFSFENICEVLKLDPGYVRVGMRRWIENRAETQRRLKVWRDPLRYRTRIGERRFGNIVVQDNVRKALILKDSLSW
jgi:hypothetical protein